MKNINSISTLNQALTDYKKVWLLIYKKGSNQSDCAFENFRKASDHINGQFYGTVDVNKTKGIHTEFNITSAPSLLEFKEGELVNVIKGCQTEDQFQSILKNSAYIALTKDDKPKQKNVVVYSTPTCSWCTTLKRYLDENKIRYRDVDVSKDQQAAEAMVRKSGQQGVPQTEINGQIIVGFDKDKINKLLNIN